jgi:CheY-like chemotaxis protein
MGNDRITRMADGYFSGSTDGTARLYDHATNAGRSMSDDKLPQPIRVLIVEDYPEVLAIAVESLESMGYQVAIARNGREALAYLNRGEAVDLLFTDLVMPGGVDGLELAHRARKLRPGLKVLLTSGYTGRTGVPDMRAVAAFPMIAKPYRFRDLDAKIRDVLKAAQ